MIQQDFLSLGSWACYLQKENLILEVKVQRKDQLRGGKVSVCIAMMFFPPSSHTEQLLTYLMVIDFESTCWEDKKKGRPEIS